MPWVRDLDTGFPAVHSAIVKDSTKQLSDMRESTPQTFDAEITDVVTPASIIHVHTERAYER